MHTEPRTGPIEVICLHDNEGSGSAQALVDYLAQISGGYHAVCDEISTITAAADNLEVWGNGAINERSLDVCMIHYAADPWDDVDSQAEIRRCAHWVAAKCDLYDIPARWLTAEQLHQPGVKGLCTHGDLTAAGYPGTDGHTDPGPYFPKAQFLAEVTNVKVQPMWNPPQAFVAGLADPEGGAWLLRDNGTVVYVGPGSTVIEGGMTSKSDRRHWGNRHGARLTPRTRSNGRPGYQIQSTDGATYIPQQQH